VKAKDYPAKIREALKKTAGIKYKMIKYKKV
jgi:hypothetical protein